MSVDLLEARLDAPGGAAPASGVDILTATTTVPAGAPVVGAAAVDILTTVITVPTATVAPTAPGFYRYQWTGAGWVGSRRYQWRGTTLGWSS